MADAADIKTIGNGKPGPGRPKGMANKSTQIAKDAIALAADKLGGAERLVAWAKEDGKNEAAFWTTIYPKLLPLQVSGPGEGGEHIHKVVREIVRPT